MTPTAETQKWIVEWSNAYAHGNDHFRAPISWSRERVWRTWESAHFGCFVDRLISQGYLLRDASPTSEAKL